MINYYHQRTERNTVQKKGGNNNEKKEISGSSLCSSNDRLTTGLAVNVSAADEKSDFAGEELSILVSAGWMDNRYDETIKRFEDTYDVTVDLQTIPADQYSDLLQSKLATDSCADIFWIQSSPFAIESTIVDPEKYCIDFTGASWENIMPETRKESCVYNDKLYGLQIWNASPEYVMVYNKTLFEENGWEVPTTYDELKELCGKIQDAGITPWFMPGADGWQHQLAFFQIGGVYEEATPGLYDDLNTNKATFADNEKMLEVLNEFKELSDAGYFGDDWIGTDSTNMSNEFGDRNCAMALANSRKIQAHLMSSECSLSHLATTPGIQAATPARQCSVTKEQSMRIL